MAKERLHCQEHGGYFNRESARGRKPTVCGGKNEVCNAAQKQPEEHQEAQMPRRVAARVRQEPSEAVSKPRSQGNASLDKGKAAKELLEAQGWTVTGKAWTEEADPDGIEGGPHYHVWASVSAARGEETLLLTWVDGQLNSQIYNIWNLDKPSANGKPNSKLPFDPDEIPDAELARYLVGVKVKWWNRLAGKEESAVCGKDTIEIEHKWTGTGDEYPAARLIKFIDADGGGYRHFRLEQLTKVG